MHYDALYNQHFDPIKRYLAIYAGQENAEELAQEVFLKVARNIDNFRGESSVKTWIYRIATNQAKDFLKGRAKKESDLTAESDLEQLDSERADKDSPESISITKEMNNCIKEFIHRLPREYSTVLLLGELEGCKIQEISEILGISQNAVKVRLHRARAKLRDKMDHGCVVTVACDSRMVCERKE